MRRWQRTHNRRGQTLEEEAKPDFLDLEEEDGDKEVRMMKDAAKDAEEKEEESVEESTSRKKDFDLDEAALQHWSKNSLLISHPKERMGRHTRESS